jgi:hypothetical protein
MLLYMILFLQILGPVVYKQHDMQFHGVHFFSIVDFITIKSSIIIYHHLLSLEFVVNVNSFIFHICNLYSPSLFLPD